jgi:hypothetical protein
MKLWVYISGHKGKIFILQHTEEEILEKDQSRTQLQTEVTSLNRLEPQTKPHTGKKI